MGINVFPAPVVSTTSTWTLIDSKTSTSGTSVSFTGISGYKTLMLSFKSVNTAAGSYLVIRINNDNAAGKYVAEGGVGTELLIATNTGARAGAIVIHDANQSATHKIEMPYYDGTTRYPLFYADAVAITRVDLVSRDGGAFNAGTVYLHGIAE
jgi:hypothetical protein